MGISGKTLLVIGAGKEQVRAYEQAHEMGLRVVGTDGSPDAPALKHADDRLICSTRDPEATLAAVRVYANKKSIHGVMTIANDVPHTVALIAETLELPGISVASARSAMDKVLMKRAFSVAGISSPKYEVIRSRAEFATAAQRWEFPFILKPSDGRGSRGVLFVDETTDLDWAWEHSKRQSEQGVLLIERYISGSQLSVEGIFVNHKYVPIAFADRNYDNLGETKPYIVEDGGIIPSRFDGKILEQIGDLVEKAAKSLGINWGSVKADVVLSADGPMIIELAARLSGNYLATHHIPMAYGVDIVSAVIHLALGEDVAPESLVPKQEKTYLGVRYFFPPTGKICEIRGTEGVKALDYVQMLDIYRRPGDNQTVVDSHVARGGTIICSANKYELAKKRVEEAVQRIEFVVA